MIGHMAVQPVIIRADLHFETAGKDAGPRFVSHWLHRAAIRPLMNFRMTVGERKTARPIVKTGRQIAPRFLASCPAGVERKQRIVDAVGMLVQHDINTGGTRQVQVAGFEAITQATRAKKSAAAGGRAFYIGGVSAQNAVHRIAAHTRACDRVIIDVRRAFEGACRFDVLNDLRGVGEQAGRSTCWPGFPRSCRRPCPARNSRPSICCRSRPGT